MTQSRQLAAIMFTDIVGYTSLMGKDEKKAFSLLNKNREIQKPIIEEYNGVWIKELGDGVMASFKTVSDAVNAAIKIQEACNATQEFQLRIGIHQGEVIIEEGDVFGDAVNIASRIQSIATPGSIFVSEVVHHNVSNKDDIHSEFVKTENLKNVKTPVRIYRIKFNGASTSKTPGFIKRIKWKSLSILILVTVVIGIVGYFIFNSMMNKRPGVYNEVTDKSIAVLPFENRSMDKEQEYFSDGLSEELLNLLAKIPELKVIGRTSSFAFKGKNEDLRVIGEKLDVAHLLEGSVQKDADKVRVRVRLIKAADGSEMWSENYTRALKNIFDLQDEIAQDVVQQLKLTLLQLPSGNLAGTGNIDAYNLVLKGNYYYDKLDKENVAKAVDLYKQALTIDSTYPRAWVKLADAYSRQAWQNYIDRKTGRELAKQAALKAIEFNKDLAEGYNELGDGYVYEEFDWKEAEKNLLKAKSLEPDNPRILYSLGGGLYFAVGKWDEAINIMKKCIELDPLRPLNHLNLGNILSHAGKMDEATYYLKKALELNPQFQRAHLYLGRNYLVTGKPDLALKEMQEENFEVFRTFGLALSYHALGLRKEADEELKTFTDKFQHEWNYLMAELYAYRGEKDKAMQWLEIAYQNKDGWLVFLKGDPLMKNLRGDQRYTAFMQKMNLTVDQ